MSERAKSTALGLPAAVIPAFRIPNFRLSTLNHDLSTRLDPSLGIIGHLSAQPFDDERARTARRLRTYSQSHAGRPWFGQGMAQLHLVLFINGQRTDLSHSLGRRPSLELGLLAFTLAKFQLGLASH
jgi:hypothetical protein